MRKAQSAWVFPGQGSQQPGMGKDLSSQFSICEPLLEEASDSLKINIKKLMWDSTDSELTLTANAQPAILMASILVAKILEIEFGAVPSVVAGHSVGEYSALAVAGVLPWPLALRAVRERGLAMQDAVPVGMGGMTAVLGPTDEQVISICRSVMKSLPSQILVAANFNSPGQVVVSGSAPALQFLKEADPAKEFGFTGRMKLIPLPVSAPFHSPMMKPAEDRMRHFFATETFASPKAVVVQNISAASESDSHQIKINLLAQVTGPVRWTESVNHIAQLGVKQVLEVGHGRVLSGLIKKIKPDHFRMGSSSNRVEIEESAKMGFDDRENEEREEGR